MKGEFGRLIQPFSDFGPLRHIVDTAYFVEKRESPLLQFADACAYAFRRSLSGLEGGGDLVKIALPEDIDYFEDVRKGERKIGFTVFVHSEETVDLMKRRYKDRPEGPGEATPRIAGSLF